MLHRRLHFASTSERQSLLQPREYLGTHGDQEGETTWNSEK